MKKNVLIGILLILIACFTSYTQTGVRLFGDFGAAPVFYEFATAGTTTSFCGSFFAGATIRQFSVGGQIDEIYMNIANNNPSGFRGAENLMRVSGVFFWQPAGWFEMKNSLGFSWTSSSFEYLQTGTIQKNRTGFGLANELEFKPAWKYFNILIINRIDFLFHLPNAEVDYQSSDLFLPYYYGGIRLNFHPFLNWIKLYTELGVTPWVYTSYPIDITTAMISVQAGISFDVRFPETINEMKNLKLEYLRYQTEKQKTILTAAKVEKKPDVRIKIVNNDLRIDKIKTAGKGDVIAFSDILFQADTDTILSSTFPILDQIAAVLIDRKTVVVDVNGHTNATGNPKDEQILSQKRAEKVVHYLVSRGVDPKRLTAKGFGGTKLSENKIGESNRRVEIKIADILKD